VQNCGGTESTLFQERQTRLGEDRIKKKLKLFHKTLLIERGVLKKGGRLGEPAAPKVAERQRPIKIRDENTEGAEVACGGKEKETEDSTKSALV